MSKAKASFARWTQEENELFEKLLGLYQKDFRKIAQHFKSRSYGQIRTHYYNELHKQGGDQQLDESASQDSTEVVVPQLLETLRVPLFVGLPFVSVLATPAFDPYECESFMFSTYFQ
ncbi:SANT/Myb_domain [Hexamita inflata]|uniref:SANT/Myb domain n=1 Tax=Hexamita inflata TaxID=28002 RepID=A0AA86PYY5_9EUKA|nr:SANT/Myb domain [Hexamita inflata]